MKYRKEIDGLRAVAILPVLVFHVGLPYLTGGYLGVDVFFVISGFLITTIIFEEIDSGNFLIFKFYERRARRILPALFAMVCATALALPLVTTNPSILATFGDSVLSVVFFVSNLFFWLTSGYFGTASELSPLLHTWSLAVEEQFYVLFPLAALAVYPLGRKPFLVLILTTILLSLLVAEWGWRNAPSGNFYLIPSRAWELAFGSASAMIVRKYAFNRVESTLYSATAATGLALVLSSYFFFSPATPHPGTITLIPVIGVALVIIFANENALVGKILSSRPLVFIGLISYSLYLWHQPILALAKLATTSHLGVTLQLVLLLIVFAVSILSWKYVETPFRDRSRFSASSIFKISGASAIFLVFLGIGLVNNSYLQSLLNPQDMDRYNILLEADTSLRDQKHRMQDSECKFWVDNINPGFESRFESCAEKYGKAIIVIGGSHGMNLYNALAMNTRNTFFVSVAKGYCRPHDFIPAPERDLGCPFDEFKDFAAEHSSSISTVVYTQTPDRLFAIDMPVATIADISTLLIDQVVNYLRELKHNAGTRVIMVGMLPPLTRSPINLDYTQELDHQLAASVSNNNVYLSTQIDKIFQEKLAVLGIPYVSKIEGIRLQLPEDLMHDGKITYSDKRHISDVGQKLFGKRLVSFLYQNGFTEFLPVATKNKLE